ncbi:MAG: ATP-dependent helicase RecG, partial [Hyphomicrobiales bacterium]|nr:ATP-dependent helicase RecG [Hyphomicrobiales bacterium]
MRPALLNSLFAPLRALPGVGPKTGQLFDRLLAQGSEEARVLDVLFHVPHATIDRRARPKIVDAERDAIVTLEVTVSEHRPPPPRNSAAPYKVLVEDETGDVQLVFFRANHGWIEKMLPLGARRWVSGRLELWDGHLQMTHPDRVMDEEGLRKLPPVEPVYGLTEGLYQRNVQRAAEAALERTPHLADWLDPAFAQARQWPTFNEALAQLHRPQTPQDIEPTKPALQRLAYDELLASQLALIMVRARMKEVGGRATLGDGAIASRIEAALPFKLTGAQQAAL